MQTFHTFVLCNIRIADNGETIEIISYIWIMCDNIFIIQDSRLQYSFEQNFHLGEDMEGRCV